MARLTAGAQRPRDGARRFTRHLAPLAFALAALAGGCSMLPFGASGEGPTVRPYPGGCVDFDLSPRRCAAIVEALRERAAVLPADVARIDLLGNPNCETDSGEQVLCTSTMSFVLRARFVTLSGRTVEESQFCGVGGQYTILCSDHPEINVGLPTSGYRDVPCGETGETCATPYPDPDPADAAMEQPFNVRELEIKLDHVGQYEISLGDGSLANGILEDSSMTLANIRPDNFLLSESGVRLEIESLAADGKPFDNYYLRGWREGVEPFTARLRFEVLWFEPGAVLRITDIGVS